MPEQDSNKQIGVVTEGNIDGVSGCGGDRSPIDDFAEAAVSRVVVVSGIARQRKREAGLTTEPEVR